MAIRCKNCGRCVEPSDKAMKSKICGFCSKKYDLEETPECFDGSPCEQPDFDCNKCEWVGGG